MFGWLQDLVVSNYIRNLEEKMGADWLKKVAAIAAMVGGAAGILTGVSCALMALSNGTLQDHYKECLALVTAGVGVFSPGVHAFKVGAFSRPTGA